MPFQVEELSLELITALVPVMPRIKRTTLGPPQSSFGCPETALSLDPRLHLHLDANMKPSVRSRVLAAAGAT